jgi:DNA repair protein RadC
MNKKKKVPILNDEGISYNKKLPEFQISLKTKAKASELYQITSSSDMADVCRKVFSEDKIDWIEEFMVIALSRANRVIGFYKVGAGGVTGVVADPKVIFQFALLSNASNLIVAHNHPSGSLRPSRADEELTAKIKEAGKLLDIKVLDHIILTSEGHYSFADEGII